MIFCITFSQDHPLVDTWIEVEAPDMGIARKYAENNFPRRWASVYNIRDFHPKYFPEGKVGLTVKIN